MFSKRQKAKVFRYKYNFLQESEDASTVVDLTHHDDVDDDSSAHSNETYSDFDSDDYFGNDDSDDTVCYDKESYYHSEIITQNSSHRNFFKSISKMSHKLALEQSQLIKTLIKTEPADFLANDEISSALEQNTDIVSVKNEFASRASAGIKQISVQPNSRLSQLKSALRKLNKIKWRQFTS